MLFMLGVNPRNMIRIILQDAVTHMEGGIYDSITECFCQMLFDDIGSPY